MFYLFFKEKITVLIPLDVFSDEHAAFVEIPELVLASRLHVFFLTPASTSSFLVWGEKHFLPPLVINLHALELITIVVALVGYRIHIGYL